jgi:NAD(P)-dependent dehydrogenase (short-subunit alcohol dehydrogenase family)
MRQAKEIPTILVTGATGHIGRAFAKEVSSVSSLILVDRDDDQLHELHASLSTTSENSHHAINCDLSDEISRRTLIETIKKTHPYLNGLINNAAFTGDENLTGWASSFENQSLDSWRAAIEVNLTAAFDLSKGLSPLLKESQDGHILNIASIYGSLGPDMRLYEGTEMGNPAAYAASKGGIIQLTKWLATVLAPDIRVNCISPGGLQRNQPQQFINRYEARTPLGRMANEDDIVGGMMFLTLGKSQYITGQNLLIDGGFSIW